MKSQGDLVSRSIMGISGVKTCVIRLLTYLLSPPDPPSRLGVSGRWSAFVLQPFALLMPTRRAQGSCLGLRVWRFKGRQIKGTGTSGS